MSVTTSLVEADEVVCGKDKLSHVFDKTWDAEKDGFKKSVSKLSSKKDRVAGPPSRFLFVANSCEYNEEPDKEVLFEIFSKYGPLYEIFITQQKPFANVAYVYVEDAINAQKFLNNKPIQLLNGRKLHIAFSVPNPPTNRIHIVPDFVSETRHVSVPSGLYLIEDFICHDEEKKLIEWIDGTSNTVPWISNFSRRVKHFGYEFDYDTLKINFDKKVDNMPSILTNLLLKATNGTNIDNNLFNEHNGGDVIDDIKSMDQCTINEYLNGNGIRPHIETIGSFTDTIMSLSLLSPIIMDFRKNETKKSIVLKPRSLLILTGTARYQWSHGISHRKYDIIDGQLTPRQRRVSLTFRTVVKQSETFETSESKSNRNASDTSDCSALHVPDVERTHVHKLYDAIAPHFSHTRHSGWPQVVNYIKRVSEEFEQNSALLGDLGCGNGKYLRLLPSIAPNIYGMGIDYSRNLCQIVSQRQCEGIVSDALNVPFADCSFDAVISIAVLHHISTQQRRLQALNEIFRVCQKKHDIVKIIDGIETIETKCGSGFVCAWAYEQDGSSRHKFEAEDTLVPWALDKKYVTREVSEDIDKLNEMNAVLVEDHKKRVITFQRYCHVYKKGELEALSAMIANIVDKDGNCINQFDEEKLYKIEIVNSFYNKGNWCFEFKRHE